MVSWGFTGTFVSFNAVVLHAVYVLGSCRKMPKLSAFAPQETPQKRTMRSRRKARKMQATGGIWEAMLPDQKKVAFFHHVSMVLWHFFSPKTCKNVGRTQENSMEELHGALTEICSTEFLFAGSGNGPPPPQSNTVLSGGGGSCRNFCRKSPGPVSKEVV